MTQQRRPMMFIHGLWLHPTSWNDWQDHFAAAGYATSAPGWPGDQDTVEAARANPDSVANTGIGEVVAHYASAIAELPEAPILVGHSFGGMIAEKLLGQGLGAAAVAVDAAQIKGVLRLPLSSLRATLPVFKNPANKHKAVMLTPREFHYGFGNALSEEESNELYERWVVPASARPLFEAASANLSPHSPAEVDTDNPDRGPLLLIVGGQDHTVPEAITKSTLKQYKDSPAVTELQEFPDRGHSLTIDAGWKEVADAALTWLEDQGF